MILIVSIHSLTQRETTGKRFRSAALTSFNPLPHAEGDTDDFQIVYEDRGFNPLPHAEGDYLLHLIAALYARFNPLPHAEGDPIP